MHQELLDPRTEKLFRDSFVRLFEEDIDSGLSEEQLSEYLVSQDFKRLNQQCHGLGYVYLGLVIHKLLDARKISYKDGKYNNTNKGIDSTLDEGLTHRDRRELVGILESGITVPSATIQGEEGS